MCDLSSKIRNKSTHISHFPSPPQLNEDVIMGKIILQGVIDGGEFDFHTADH